MQIIEPVKFFVNRTTIKDNNKNQMRNINYKKTR